ncbi:MAG: M15 family metallopeptidase [Ruminococcaceae bacterium]|nr:M15 family metallopeptidase [Oscillospiraceae bacterium]
MRQAARSKRRQKRRTQRILVLAAFVVAAVLLVVCIVMVFSSIFGGDKKDPSSTPPASAVSASQPDSVPQQVPGGTPAAADPTAWNLILINKQKPMADGFSPETVSVSELGHQFDARAADAIKQMVADCNAVEGHTLSIISAYRGPVTQNKKNTDLVAIFKSQGNTDAEAQQKADEVEPAYGYSDHQTGLGVDFVTGGGTETVQAFADTPEYQWLTQHAAEYGFVLRFPYEKASITGISYQPYHWRYVGAEDAAAMTGAGICLEEYLRETNGATGASQPEAGSQADSGGSSTSQEQLG